ncbi:MAG: four helix bundle protein [Bacteroidia bacterium]|nr:four helix bundle protein [Bacteroidia bacterium]
MKNIILVHTDLIVFQNAFNSAVQIHQFSQNFPSEEKFSLTDQIRRSSRSVAANLAEAFRKRRYPKSFISKLTDSEGEAAETQVWLKFANTFNYLNSEDYNKINSAYDRIIAQIVTMVLNPDKWTF